MSTETKTRNQIRLIAVGFFLVCAYNVIGGVWVLKRLSSGFNAEVASAIVGPLSWTVLLCITAVSILGRWRNARRHLMAVGVVGASIANISVVIAMASGTKTIAAMAFALAIFHSYIIYVTRIEATRQFFTHASGLETLPYKLIAIAWGFGLWGLGSLLAGVGMFDQFGSIGLVSFIISSVPALLVAIGAYQGWSWSRYLALVVLGLGFIISSAFFGFVLLVEDPDVAVYILFGFTAFAFLIVTVVTFAVFRCEDVKRHYVGEPEVELAEVFS